MGWTAPRTWVTAEVVSASNLNTHVRDNFLETAPAKSTAADRIFISSGANTLKERVPDATVVATSETTTSTSYTDLATAGPVVTSTTGTRALVIVTAAVSVTTAGAKVYMGIAVSGATTDSADDASSLVFTSDSSNQQVRASSSHFFEGLTGGSNVFTAKYKVSAGTGTFINRQIFVLPLS